MRLRPSLVRRLLLAFVLGPALVIVTLLVLIRPVLLQFGGANVASTVVIALIAPEIVVHDDGTLALGGEARILDIAKRSPGLWFIIWKQDQRITFGQAPTALPLLGQVPPMQVKEAHLGAIDAEARASDLSIMQVELDSGLVTIAAGGVEPRAITTGDWLAYAYRDSEVDLGILLIMLICLSGGPLAIPIVLRAIRPTARAAARLGPEDLRGRLSEKGVVKELLPLVRSFNAVLDRLAEAFDRRRRFIADVAHELRTPLAVLRLQIDAAPEGEHKTGMQRTLFRLGEMVAQMLDSERLALAGRQREAIDLVALAKAISADIAPLAISSGYELMFEAPPEAIMIEGDRFALTRAVSNLLGNAIAHGGGAGAIQVRVTPDAAIEVLDQGPGVPVHASERIFEPFYRERWDRDGCGLGLHLVRQIMQAHGGTAVLMPDTRGARFRLSFPS